jgi:hypothetical protein
MNRQEAVALRLMNLQEARLVDLAQEAIAGSLVIV